MAINPPYRFDPIQNPIDVDFEREGGGDGEPGSKDCWGFFLGQFINPDISVILRWPTGDQSYTTDPGTAAASFGFRFWYLDPSNVIVCYEWGWLSSTDCGFAPGPTDTPPPDPPDDWIGFGFSPNSEE